MSLIQFLKEGSVLYKICSQIIYKRYLLCIYMPPKVKAIALLSGSTNSYIPCVYLDLIKSNFSLYTVELPRIHLFYMYTLSYKTALLTFESFIYVYYQIKQWIFHASSAIQLDIVIRSSLFRFSYIYESCQATWILCTSFTSKGLHSIKVLTMRTKSLWTNTEQYCVCHANYIWTCLHAKYIASRESFRDFACIYASEQSEDARGLGTWKIHFHQNH